MAAPVVPEGNERRLAFVGPPATQMSATVTAPIATTLPRFAGFQDVRHPEEFLSKVDNFCLINDIALEDRVRVVTAALDGSAKLWHRFAGPFATWDAFVTAFRREFALADEKKRLTEELEARTQHPEENLKEFVYVISEFYDRIREEVADDVKIDRAVDRVLRQMHPPAARLGSGVHLLKLEGPGGCGRWPDGASAAPATISASSTQNKSGRARLRIFGA
ncbi:hypothetical protein MRX96_000304 [Rhipicephalus microplus]